MNSHNKRKLEWSDSERLISPVPVKHTSNKLFMTFYNNQE